MAQNLTVADIEAARERIGSRIQQTETIHVPELGRLANCDLYLKLENRQLTGSFKVRGALNAMALLAAEQSRNGVATFSAGNHGQALAYAAMENGVPCTVYMAANASAAKIDAIRSHGANVSQFPTIQEAFEAMERESQQRGVTIVMPFSEPEVIAGQGTVGLEILEEVPDLEQLIVPVGGGGLISGVATAVKARKPDVRIVGVCAAGSPAVARALAEGKPVHLESVDTIADGLGAPFTTELNLELIRSHVDDVVTVTDDEIAAALKILVDELGTPVEPAGAATVAALLTGKAAVPVGAVSVAVVSGGNIDPVILERLI